MRRLRLSSNRCANYRLIGRLCFLTATASILGGCVSINSQSHHFTNNDSMRFRSVAEQRETERKALAGDVEAAKRLGDYYVFVKHDLGAARPWFSRAAARGDKDAKASLRSIDEIQAERGD